MMDEPIQIFTVKEHFERGRFIEGNTLKIFTDDNPMNPRTEFDNLGHMICFHKRYNLGDKTDLKSSDFTSWDDLEKHLIKKQKACIILPIFMFDHSGITISTHPFNDRWDSGQIGYIYVTKEDIKKEYGTDKITPELREIINRVLNGEVSEYDQYLTGEVYGYQPEDPSGEIIDSCWGYFGYPYGIEQIKSECGIV